MPSPRNACCLRSAALEEKASSSEGTPLERSVPKAKRSLSFPAILSFCLSPLALHLIPYTPCLAPCAGGLAPICFYPPSNFHRPPSAFRLPHSAFPLPPSAFRFPPSAFIFSFFGCRKGALTAPLPTHWYKWAPNQPPPCAKCWPIGLYAVADNSTIFVSMLCCAYLP